MKKLNLNEAIKVKLTPLGVNIFYHQYDEVNKVLSQRGGKQIASSMPRIDENGFTKFQLHYFMKLYGNYMRLGAENVIENLSIYIYDKDLEDCEEE